MAIDLTNVGKNKPSIDVVISYRIIQLFSEGLYASPNKAVEELVANSFDAGAQNVHVILSPDLSDQDSLIAVIDDGDGMDEDGLRFHWRIGVSNKRNARSKFPRNRKQIGKFGIGKLATYVLAKELTHISKVNGSFFATSMNYSDIPHDENRGIQAEKPVSLPLKQLSESEASGLLADHIDGSKPGFRAIRLFGKGAAPNWTIALLTDLKPMASDIKLGPLGWVLQTAMPLRDDFKLYLNGDEVTPSKVRAKKIGRWVLGKDIRKLPKPAPDDLAVTTDSKADAKAPDKFGLTHPQLGRITGYVEMYEDLLTTGKSADIERSHGFFVYVRGRMVNLDDEYFGIDSNLLRHGTFARFRMVVNVDKLDEELRSSRENVRQGVLFHLARNVLHGAFNFARTRLEEHAESTTPGVQASRRITGVPASLSHAPIIALVAEAMAGKIEPLFVRVPSLPPGKKQEQFIATLRARVSAEDFVSHVTLEDLSTDDPIAIFDAELATLRINTLHPFVAYFLDDFSGANRSLPLELMAWSEVLLEAGLYREGLASAQVREILSQRDQLIRHLARSTDKRTAYHVAQDLMDAATDQHKLEQELVAAFESMGFDAVPKGGSGKPDGIATAKLSAANDGTAQRYRVSLEAKSKQDPAKKVTAKTVNISAIARQRDDFHCDHALIAGPDFPTTKSEDSALVKEIRANKKQTNKTITLIRIVDLARLVRLVPLKHVHLKRMRSLLDCVTPEECITWIDELISETPPDQHYLEVLETIWQEQDEAPLEVVEYGSLMTALRKGPKLTFSKDEVRGMCVALSRMAPEYVVALDNSVQIMQRPDKILQAIGATISKYPSAEQKSSVQISDKAKKTKRTN